MNNVKDQGKRKLKGVDLILNHNLPKMKTRRKRKISKRKETNREKRRKEKNQNQNRKLLKK